ncbi:MAG TPA: SLC45 family MFS transporter [Anaerolineaceae bacterium]
MKLNYGKTFLLGFGFFGVSVIWGVYNAFVPIFLEKKFLLDPWLIGFFMTLDNIAALLIQPPVGAWSDRLRTPLGRRMPFILIGAPIGAIAFGLIPLAAILPLFVACTTSLLISMAFWRTPVVALMPDITPSQFRSPANGIINFMGGVGSIISFLVGSSLYEKNPAYPFWLGSALVVGASLLVLTFIREPKEYYSSEWKLTRAPAGSTLPDEETPSLWRSFKGVWQDSEKSPLRVLIAIFSWFVAYNGIEAFFTLYAVNHLGMKESDGTRLLGQLSLLFVICALPAGYIGKRIGRRKTIMAGITGMMLLMFSMYIIPSETLVIQITKLPVLGVVPVIGLLLMAAGASWSLININSLPMVVDMTDEKHIGTFTGLYYLFSTLAAIAGPNINGWIVQLLNKDYRYVMVVAPFFMLAALISMAGVRRGEMKTVTAA